MEQQSSPVWQELKSQDQFDLILENSMIKPALILKSDPKSDEGKDVKTRLNDEWDLPDTELQLFHLDETEHGDVATKMTEMAGVDAESPQVLLFADGVTMYDESHDMISVKKIKIALKIINRTFKWMESRA